MIQYYRKFKTTLEKMWSVEQRDNLLKFRNSEEMTVKSTQPPLLSTQSGWYNWRLRNQEKGGTKQLLIIRESYSYTVPYYSLCSSILYIY